MAGIPSYGSIVKPFEELINENYCYKNSLATVTIQGKDKSVGWKVRGDHHPQEDSDTYETKVTGSGALEFNFDQGKFRLKKNLESITQINAEYTPKTVAGIKLKYKGQSNAAEKEATKTGTLEYDSESIKAQLAVKDGSSIKGNITYGKSLYGGVGLDGEYSLGAGRLTAYNAAFWLAFNNSRLIFRHQSQDKKEYNIGDLGAIYHWNVDKDTEVGVAVGEFKDGLNGLIVAGKKRVCPGLEVKAKYNQALGKLAFSLNKKASDRMSVTLAGQFFTKSFSSSKLDANFGVRADFTA